jgi:tRNA pseudouridine38-40 synthase
MEEGAILLIGKKDFGGFQNSGAEKSSTIREIESISIEGESFYHFTLIGNSFLYKMVRNIVGTLVYIGSGKLAISDIEKTLRSNKREHAGICAPAHGLTLKRVYYDFKK